MANKVIKSGTTARSVKEWIGRDPDARVPLRTQLRILERQGGKCALTGRRFRPGDKKRLDHIVALADGGENREANLQWIFDESHKEKTKAEAATRAKVQATQKAHAGIKAEPRRKIQSAPFPTAKEPKDRIPQAHGLTPLMRQLGTKKEDLE